MHASTVAVFFWEALALGIYRYLGCTLNGTLVA